MHPHEVQPVLVLFCVLDFKSDCHKFSRAWPGSADKLPQDLPQDSAPANSQTSASHQSPRDSHASTLPPCSCDALAFWLPVAGLQRPDTWSGCQHGDNLRHCISHISESCVFPKTDFAALIAIKALGAWFGTIRGELSASPHSCSRPRVHTRLLGRRERAQEVEEGLALRVALPRTLLLCATNQKQARAPRPPVIEREREHRLRGTFRGVRA
eukprot:1811981-Rhodomonas_salina.2